MYQIKVQNQIDSSLSAWFNGFTIDYTPDGNTLLTGEVVDQAALYGILIRCRDLGMTLLSINRLLAIQTDKDIRGKNGSNNRNETAENNPC